jgi:hypothetical protein
MGWKAWYIDGIFAVVQTSRTFFRTPLRLCNNPYFRHEGMYDSNPSCQNAAFREQ